MSSLDYIYELLERTVYRLSARRRLVLKWVINYYFRQNEITVYSLAFCCWVLCFTVWFPVLRSPVVYGLAGVFLAVGLLGVVRPFRWVLLRVLAWLIE